MIKKQIGGVMIKFEKKAEFVTDFYGSVPASGAQIVAERMRQLGYVSEDAGAGVKKIK